MIQVGDRFDLSAYVPTMFDCTVIATALSELLLDDGELLLAARSLKPSGEATHYRVRETLLDESRWSVRRLS